MSMLGVQVAWLSTTRTDTLALMEVERAVTSPSTQAQVVEAALIFELRSAI